MTTTDDNKIKDFLKVDEFPSGYGSGYGSGDGDGSGSGDGYGNGYGYGDGNGSGNGYGYGDGSGYGNGYGSGDGDGNGSGDGDGSGSGDGYGSGYGYGDGNGIKQLNGKEVYHIDGIPTLIDSVHGNYAKGRILNDDMTTKECYIAKCGNYFAHGETLKEAMYDAREKYEENSPIEERIARFNELFPDRDVPVPASDLFRWHHILTGSCLMGRVAFCESRGLDYKDGMYTVNEFIDLTKGAYGGEIIKKLIK